MSDVKLLACPFCGEKVEIIEHKHTHWTSEYTTKCQNPACVIHPESMAYDTVQELSEAWNTRKPMDRIVEQLDNEIEDNESNEVNRAWNRALDYAIEIIKKGGAQYD